MIRFFFLFLSIFLAFKCEAQELAVEVIKNGPVHEAFMTKESDELILQATPLPPPDAIRERIPTNSDVNLGWIPGYWAWSKERNDHIWVSGTFRRAPPGMQWIPGEWEHLEEGWVWLPGFWSPVAEEKLQALINPPPEPLDEKIPPCAESNFFWMKGYWKWDDVAQKYAWVEGRWEKFDPNWIYTPPRYLWRPQGYLSLPPYWDWPIEKRGIVFSSVHIPTTVRKETVYYPESRWDALQVFQLYFPCWPDYQSIYQYHFYYHPELWDSWGISPPWWQWPAWWGFTQRDSWWLWWWWTHPDYPQPFWLKDEMTAYFSPPPELIINLMATVPAPILVSSYGVISQQALLKSIKKVTGEPQGPILPTDPRETEDIKKFAKPAEVPTAPFLKPTGSREEKSPPPKPFFGPSLDSLSSPPQRIRPPAKPPIPTQDLHKTPELHKKIQRPLPPAFPQLDSESLPSTKSTQPTYKPRQDYPRLPEYDPSLIPRKKRTTTPQKSSPSDRYPPSLPKQIPTFPTTPLPPPSQTSQAAPQPRIYQKRYPRPPYHDPFPLTPDNPYQGQKPVENWPPLPQAQQDKGNFMSHPMPQRNPQGPSVMDPEGKQEAKQPGFFSPYSGY